MRAHSVSVAFLSAVLAAACGDGSRGGERAVRAPGGEGGQAGRGVLLVCVDSLRADHVSSNGYDRETTPVLDGLAADGVSFTQAFSTAPWLLPAHVSILTGCDPYIALRPLPEDLRPSMVTLWHIPDLAPRLSKEFLRNGYATAAFSDHAWVAPVHGFRQGFQTFFEHKISEVKSESDVGIEGLGGRFEQWLRNRPREQDWFAYLHLHDLERTWREADPVWDTYFPAREELDLVPPVGVDTHVFFAIPQRRWLGGLRSVGEYEAQYDGAVRKLDTALGRLFARMRHMERWDDTTVVVVGTYGVGLGEEGILLDHGMLADVDLHVPLIIRPATGSGLKRGIRSPVLTSVADLAPTLLDLQRLVVPVEMQGVSVARALAGDERPAREHAFARCGFQAGYVIMDDRWCYARTFPRAVRDRSLALSWYGNRDVEDDHPSVVLHDRWAKPTARHIDLGPGDKAVASGLRAAAENWLDQVEVARKRLQALTWPTPVDAEGVPSERLPTGGSPGSPP